MAALNAIYMSLDEYIKVKGFAKQYEKPKEIFSEAPKKTDFKSRNKEEENADGADYGDDDSFMKDSIEVVGLNYMKEDFDNVYSKSLNENASNSLQIPYIESQQWKNGPSNVNGADGLRPIVPRNPLKKQQFFKQNNGGVRYQKKKNNYGNKKQYRNNNNKNKVKKQNIGGNGNYGGGGICVKKYNQMEKRSEKKLPNNGFMTARARALAMQKSVFKIQQQQQQQQSSDSVHTLNSEESISQKLAVSRQSAVFNIEKMPLTQNNVDAFAGNFMNFLNTYETVVHKPVYDLQIQGNIAQIQNKIIHCSNTGMVMPTSGRGIVCSIQPHASSTPLAFRHC